MSRVLPITRATAQAKPARPRRAVVAPDGTVYGSLTQAAKDHGVWPAAISLRATLGKGGWRDATPEELAAIVAE